MDNMYQISIVSDFERVDVCVCHIYAEAHQEAKRLRRWLADNNPDDGSEVVIERI